MPHVEGFLISRSSEGLRLLVAHSAVVVSESNVERVEHLDVPPLPDAMEAVRVHYREALLPGGRLPFILATRQEPVVVFDSPRYAARERHFLEAAGLGGPAHPGPPPT